MFDEQKNYGLSLDFSVMNGGTNMFDELAEQSFCQPNDCKQKRTNDIQRWTVTGMEICLMLSNGQTLSSSYLVLCRPIM